MQHRDDDTFPDCAYPGDCALTEALRARALARNQPIERSASWREALPRAKSVRLLLLDVDGVLTDGGIIYGNDGLECKRFNTRDGLGIAMLQENGIEVGIITARASEAVERRARELRLAHLVQGERDKLASYEALLRQTGLRPPQTAYMGDDLIDLPLLNRAGLAASPADAVPEVRRRVHYVAQCRGGEGAVREVCDLILEAQGLLARACGRYDR
ncbi:MAG: KdsC family phosphatase [Desulfobulbus sp.]|jgi:3-deoxy-D-manno-octulosonate 8-phosphate phosphatase (KDO 8-P phosphatase)